MSNDNINTYRITVLYEALSPITQAKGTSGNESIINTQQVIHNQRVINVPCLSGNALRNRIIRDSGSRHLINVYGLYGQVTIEQANFILVGGNLSETSTTNNLKVIADMKETFPLFRLLGGSLRSQILAGSLQNGYGLLVCEENRKSINGLMPKSFDLPEKLKSYENFISSYQYTRGDIKNNKRIQYYLKESDLSIDKDSTLMIYSGQSLIAGSLFFQDIVFPNVSKLELGAYLTSMEVWKNNGGIIGGKSSIGHGKLKPYVYVESNDGIITDYQNYIDLYNEHIIKVKHKAIEWLNVNFGDKPKKESKKEEKEEGVLV